MVDPDTVRHILNALDGESEPAVLVRLVRGPIRSAHLRRAVSRAMDSRTFTAHRRGWCVGPAHAVTSFGYPNDVSLHSKTQLIGDSELFPS